MTKRQWIIKFVMAHKWGFLCEFICGGYFTVLRLADRTAQFHLCPVGFFVVNVLGKKTKQAGEKLWVLQTGYQTFLHSTFKNWK
ncbi:MAG: hypothetical protein LBI03_00490, partial [Clostridiales bacterium]|nr:hypothetical protein [Clostridiales bacterium]